MRTFRTETIRKREAEPFHQHTYRFPHRHWFVLALLFLVAGVNPGVYPRTDPKDGTVAELQTEDGKIRSIVFTEARYQRTVTRI